MVTSSEAVGTLPVFQLLPTSQKPLCVEVQKTCETCESSVRSSSSSKVGRKKLGFPRFAAVTFCPPACCIRRLPNQRFTKERAIAAPPRACPKNKRFYNNFSLKTILFGQALS